MNTALIQQARTVRSYTLRAIQGLSAVKLLTVPELANNSILWNLGHVVTDQCTMLYGPSGLPYPLPQRYLERFAPGTSPHNWTTPPDIDEVIQHAGKMDQRIADDYAAGAFARFQPAIMDDGVHLPNVDEALAHCTVHEAIHLGIILMLRKLV